MIQRINIYSSIYSIMLMEEKSNIDDRHQKLINLVQLQIHELAENLQIMNQKHSINELKEAVTKSYCIYASLQPIFSDISYPMLYANIKKVINNLGFIFLTLIDRFEYNDKTGLESAKSKLQIKDEMKQQQKETINQHSIVNQYNQIPKKNIKAKRLGGVSLYNESYQRGIDHDKNKKKVFSIEEIRQFILKQTDQMIEQLDRQELDARMQSDEISNFIKMRKKNQNLLNVQNSNVQDLEQIVTFFRQTQEGALNFLNKNSHFNVIKQLKQQLSDLMMQLKRQKKDHQQLLWEKIQKILDHFRFKYEKMMKYFAYEYKKLEQARRKLFKTKVQKGTQTTVDYQKKIQELSKALEQEKIKYQNLENFRRNDSTIEQDYYNVLKDAKLRDIENSKLSKQLQARESYIQQLEKKIRNKNYSKTAKIQNLESSSLGFDNLNDSQGFNGQLQLKSNASASNGWNDNEMNISKRGSKVQRKMAKTSFIRKSNSGNKKDEDGTKQNKISSFNPNQTTDDKIRQDHENQDLQDFKQKNLSHAKVRSKINISQTRIKKQPTKKGSNIQVQITYSAINSSTQLIKDSSSNLQISNRSIKENIRKSTEINQNGMDYQNSDNQSDQQQQYKKINQYENSNEQNKQSNNQFEYYNSGQGSDNVLKERKPIIKGQKKSKKHIIQQSVKKHNKVKKNDKNITNKVGFKQNQQKKQNNPNVKLKEEKQSINSKKSIPSKKSITSKKVIRNYQNQQSLQKSNVSISSRVQIIQKTSSRYILTDNAVVNSQNKLQKSRKKLGVLNIAKQQINLVISPKVAKYVMPTVHKHEKQASNSQTTAIDDHIFSYSPIHSKIPTAQRLTADQIKKLKSQHLTQQFSPQESDDHLIMFYNKKYANPKINQIMKKPQISKYIAQKHWKQSSQKSNSTHVNTCKSPIKKNLEIPTSILSDLNKQQTIKINQMFYVEDHKTLEIKKKQFLKQHIEKCGSNCIHLQRYFEMFQKIRAQIFSEQGRSIKMHIENLNKYQEQSYENNLKPQQISKENRNPPKSIPKQPNIKKSIISFPSLY